MRRLKKIKKTKVELGSSSTNREMFTAKSVIKMNDRPLLDQLSQHRIHLNLFIEFKPLAGTQRSLSNWRCAAADR